MIPFDILPLRLGRSAAESLNPKEQDFYLWVATTVLKKKCTPAWSASKSTIPIDAASLNEQPSEIYSHIVKSAGLAEAAATALIVDITNPRDAVIRGALDLHIGSALEFLHNDRQLKRVSCIILLLAQLPPKGDVLRKVLQPLLAAKRLVVIAADGKHLGSQTFFEGFKESDYHTRLSRVRGEPIDLLHLKMIRRLGHFRRGSGNHVYCLRHFFDGRQCSDEIESLLSTHIATHYPHHRLYLLYDDTHSDWFSAVVLTVADQLLISCYSIKSVIEREATLDESHPALLVSFLVDTGGTFLRQIESIMGLYSGLHIKTFSILSTKGESKPFSERQLKRGEMRIECDYCLKVDRERHPHPCDLCKLDIAVTDDNTETSMLTTYDFWDMAMQYPPHPEKDVPEGREPLPFVPDFREMIKEHGPWLASKMSALIALASDDATSDTVIVCPDEEGAEALARYLDLATGATVIRIPKRNVLDKLTSPESISVQREQWKRTQPHWFVSLTTIAANEVVILDEFNVSLGTYSKIERLVSIFNLGVRCFIPMVDFNPELSRRKLKVPKYSLYEWQHSSVRESQ